MNFSHLEKRLKGLNHYESEINAADVWEQLEPKINTRDSRRKILYFRLFGFSILLIAIFGISFLFTNQNNNQRAIDRNTDIAASNNTEIKTSNYIINENETEIKNTFIKKDLPTQKLKETNIAILPSVNIEPQRKDKDLMSLAVENHVEENKSVLINKSNGSLHQNNSAILGSHFVPSKSTLNKEKIENITTHSIPFFTQVENINSLQLSIFDVDKSSLFTPTPLLGECPLINKTNPKLSFSIRPYVDYDIPMTRLSGKGTDINLETIRNRVESNYIAYSFGVELRAKARSGIHVFTGYNQSLIRDQFDYSIEKDTMILLEDIIKNITINENQDSVITIGDSLVNARVIETGRKFANYKSIDIPIGFEFSKRVSKLEFGISAAALLNLTFGTTGSVYNENEEISSLNGKYKNSIGARFRFSTPIQYYIGRKLNIGFAPAFTYSPKSTTSLTYPIDHKVNLFSMRIFADFSF